MPNSFISRILISSSIVALGVSPALAGPLSGQVTDSEGGYPLPGASVTITELGTSTVTGSDGTYRFAELPNGTYTLTIEYLGTDPVTQSVTIDESASTLNIAMGAARDEILVVGQRASLLSSINQQRNADNLVSIVTADAIGQFPDQNVTEAARRVPGVSVENDQGEGRFIVIRGVDPNLNTTSINGVRIPAPEGGARGAALDVIDSEVLSAIEVTKSLTPDLDGDGIGGNIDIKTVTAFDRKGAYLKLKGAGTYNEQMEEWGPKVSLSASNIFADGTLGIAVSASYRERNFGSENYEVDGGFTEGDAPFDTVRFPEQFELRDYDITRERTNLALNADYRPGENHTFYLRTLWSDFSDLEYRSRVEIEGDPDEITAVNGNTVVFGEGEVDRDIKDRLETQQIWSASIGGDSQIGSVSLDYSLSYSHAEEEEPGRLDSEYRYGGDELRLDVGDALRPVFSFTDSDYATASAFEFNGAEALDGITQDDEWAMGLNIRKDMNFGRHPGYLKAGVKSRLREKSRNVDLIAYDDDDSFTLDATDRTVDYSPFNIGPVPDPTLMRAFLSANAAGLDLKFDDIMIGSNVEDYTASEDILAGYLMGSIDIDRLRLVGGVRIEQTEYEGEGRDVRVFEEDSTIQPGAVAVGSNCIDVDNNTFFPNVGAVMPEDVICVSVSSNDDDYTDVLPSLVAKFDMNDNIVLRGSYYRSVARPNFGALVPAAEISQNDDDEFEGELGNITALGIPRLDHQTADSFDAGIEYYTRNGGVVSLGIFHKNYQDFIAPFLAEDFDAGFATFDEAVFAVNLDDASLTGLEFNVQQNLDFLDGPLSGLLGSFNYTVIDGEATDLDGNKIALPKQSENIMNAAIGYDKYGADIRLAVSHRGEYLDEVGGRTVDEHTQWDFSAKYEINDHFRIFGDISNLTDEPFVALDINGNSRELSQFEEYGRTFEIGIQYKY